MLSRSTVVVTTPAGGWPPPWPEVAELEAALPLEHWSLIGGLMVQLWAFHYGIEAVRPDA